MSNIRSLPKLIVGLSVWRINFTAETDQREFANFSLFQKWKLEITQELWVQLCSNTALLKRTEKLFHTMFIIQRETAAHSRQKFMKIKNLKKSREFSLCREKWYSLSLLFANLFTIKVWNATFFKEPKLQHCLDALTHLYQRVRPYDRPSVWPSVRPVHCGPDQRKTQT